MARILPDDLDAVRATGRFDQELETLDRMRAELADNITVYHGVHWTRMDNDGAAYGEIDFLVVNRYGRILAIEQKNGPVEMDENDLTKQYPDGPKSVVSQVARNVGALRQGFSRRFGSVRLDIDPVYYCPDARLSGNVPSNLAPGRVIDASKAKYLCDLLRAWFDQRPEPAPQRPSRSGEVPVLNLGDLETFLGACVQLVPDIGALSARAAPLVTRLSAGLSTWASRLSLAPQRLRVIGTAGSGKTQLALRELRDAHEAGKRALYVCFNRPLADAMRLVAPDPGACRTFHELAAEVEKAAGGLPQWSEPGVFDRLAEQLEDRVTCDPTLREWVDVLIVDEGQDFRQPWAETVLAMTRRDARVTWLEDPMQNLYGRAPVMLDGWPVLRSPVNCRSPRRVVDLIQALELAGEPIEAGGGLLGFYPQLASYVGNPVTCTSEAVRQMLVAGHPADRIAVITMHGLRQSEVMGAQLGGLAVRRSMGYGSDGNAIWSDGELTVETVFRFKGQSADAVVITEIDFEQWTDLLKRQLFVALTRARLRVTLVATERAARAITAVLTVGTEGEGQSGERRELRE